MWWKNLINFVSSLGMRVLDALKKRDGEKAIDAVRRAGDDAVDGSEDAVNLLTDKARQKLGFPVTVFFLCASVLSGCKSPPPKITYIPADQRVYRTESTNGVPGWFVPDASMQVYQRACKRTLQDEFIRIKPVLSHPVMVIVITVIVIWFYRKIIR